jgi:hypothetical protein
MTFIDLCPSDLYIHDQAPSIIDCSMLFVTGSWWFRPGMGGKQRFRITAADLAQLGSIR